MVLRRWMLEAEGSVWKMLQERRQRPDEAEREISEIWSIQGPDIPLKFWDEDSSHTGNEGSPPKLRTPCQWPVRWFQDLSPATALNWNLIIICSNQEACSFPDPAERNTVLWISWFQSWETKLSSSMSSLDFWKLLRVLFKSPKWKWSHSVMSDFCNCMDCSLPSFSVHGIFQARVPEWIVISFSRISSQPRDRTQVSRITGRRLTLWASRKD